MIEFGHATILEVDTNRCREVRLSTQHSELRQRDQEKMDLQFIAHKFLSQGGVGFHFDRLSVSNADQVANLREVDDVKTGNVQNQVQLKVSANLLRSLMLIRIRLTCPLVGRKAGCP